MAGHHGLLPQCKRVKRSSFLERLMFWSLLLLQDKSPFVDDRFPPMPSSLVVGKAPPEFNKVNGWLRPSQLRGTDSRAAWSVCRTPMASDIQQGR